MKDYDVTSPLKLMTGHVKHSIGSSRLTLGSAQSFIVMAGKGMSGSERGTAATHALWSITAKNTRTKKLELAQTRLRVNGMETTPPLQESCKRFAFSPSCLYLER